MTGEMLSIDPVTGIDSNGEEYYFHSAIAKALNGKVMPFDKYQGPYVLIGNDITVGNPPYRRPVPGLGVTRLWLISDKKFPVLCRWYNEANNKISSAFIDGKSKSRIWLAIDAAREVI